MPAPITMHGKWEDNYDDADHPIPSLTALDVCGVKVSGGADLMIVVASPLMADERSQHRLLEKIDFYLRYLITQEFELESGIATPDNTAIIVKIHPESDPAIFELLERSKQWVLSNHASLKVELLDQQNAQINQ